MTAQDRDTELQKAGLRPVNVSVITLFCYYYIIIYGIL